MSGTVRLELRGFGRVVKRRGRELPPVMVVDTRSK